jgi:ferritin-like metal-binding protein YciE
MARGNDREIVVDWLNSAYAMEKGLIPILENHAKDAERHPSVRARVEQHVDETRRHAELVAGCLEQLGEKPSKVRGALSGMAGTLQSFASGPFKDEEVKNALTDYATEHFEIASYRALSEAARAIGEEGIAQTCEQIMREEQDMANFLEQNLPNTVRDALGQER